MTAALTFLKKKKNQTKAIAALENRRNRSNLLLKKLFEGLIVAPENRCNRSNLIKREEKK